MSVERGSLHERAFRLLLRAYPGWFRQAYGAEMAELFRARLGRAAGARRKTRLWLRTLGDALSTTAALRHSRPRREGRRRMGDLGRDVRHVARQLGRAPLFAAGAVLLLAIGIGANIAVFSLVDALLLRPPPFDRPDEVVYVYQDSDDGVPSSSAFPAYRDMRASEVFTDVAATSTSSASWERADGPADATIEYTTAGYLNVLGLRPLRGRWFVAEEDVPGGPLAAVVSAAAWRARMGADPDVVGSTIRINGQPVTIVGVGPEEWSGSYHPIVTDFWLSIAATAVGGPGRVANLERREDHWYDVRARLAPGVTVAQAQAAMDALALAMGEQYPDLDRGRGITVFRAGDVRAHPSQDGATWSAAGLLGAIVVTLLLLACANLANLLLARGIGRTNEVAVRRALGAGTFGVVRLFLLEAVLLSLAGGLAGLALARWALGALQSLPLPFPLSATLELPIDLRLVAFAVGLTLLTGVLAGLAPALRSRGQDVASTLRDGRRSSSAGRGTARVRNALVAVQVGASLVLVLGAGLLTRSLGALQDIDTGVDADRVAWLRTNFAAAGITGPQSLVVFDELRMRLEALPSVTSAAAATRLPAQPSGTTTTIVEGYTPPTGTGAVELGYTVVTPEYFETVGLPLVAGRGFTSGDDTAAERVVLVNEAAARTFWGGIDPVGRRLRSQSNPDVARTVIGVVADAPVSSLSETTPPMFYAPAAQSALGGFYVLVRTTGDPSAVLAPMREELRSVRSTLPVLRQGTLASHFADALAGPALAARIMGAISLLAMVLAGLGTYAVVAFGVARRSGELGIRMALGARRGTVVRMVVGETAGTVLIGIAFGVAVALLAAPRLEGVLFGVAPLDAVTFTGAVLVLAGVAGLAAWIPARRAARADPSQALRAS